MTTLSELSASRELMANLTLRELRSKYKRSVLGWTWSLVNPLVTMAIFTVVFRFFLRVAPPVGDPSGLNNFAFFLLCGLLPWNFMSSTLGAGIGSLVANGNLIKKVYFPREVVVASTVLAGDVAFLIEMGVLAVALLFVGNMVLPWLVGVLVLIVLLSLFVLGLSLALSVVNVYFQDVQYLIGIAMQVWFYATPIVYPQTLVPDVAHVAGFEVPVRTLYGFNPMVRFVEAFRDCLYDLRLPNLSTMAYLTSVSLGSLVIGAFIFSRLQHRLAEEL